MGMEKDIAQALREMVADLATLPDGAGDAARIDAMGELDRVVAAATAVQQRLMVVFAASQVASQFPRTHALLTVSAISPWLAHLVVRETDVLDTPERTKADEVLAADHPRL